MPRLTSTCVFAFICAAILLSASPVAAFCGFFVGPKDGLYNDATQVVLMRHGLETVLSMRPDYNGPAEDFAMVIPVPKVLKKADVRTLTPAPFEEIDKLSSPRLVEYHEQDPCLHHKRTKPIRRKNRSGRKSAPSMKLAEADDAPPPVRVVEKFKVAEYDIVILDADESNALEQWLNANGYKQPKGAAKYLAPYIQDGSYFFAAKVDIELVPRNQQGQALLSPIQFRYTSEEFKLPIRLGLLNARGDQDLLIFVLAEDRYEAANRKSIFIPTNISVSHKRKKDFATWYDKLFARQMNKSTPTMVTEYVWPTSVKCDPCPPGAFMLRGVNQLGGNLMQNKPNPQKMVLTRLHTRYGKSAGTSDIIFKKATPVTGGREVRKKGKLEQGATKADRNMFQARYAIRFRWKKAITCDDPRRGIWTHNVSVSPFFNQSGMRPPTRRPSRRPAPVLQELQ